MKRRIIVIAGPTASGKTGTGVRLARDFNGEIISADSRQIYRGLDLGTGKEGRPGVASRKSKVESRKLGSEPNIEFLREHLRYIDDIPQWLIDICEPRLAKDGASPGEDFSVFDWVKLAREAIDDIFSRGKTPIVVGGTGLYIQALVEGFALESITNNQETITKHLSREQLEGMTREELQRTLKELDEETYKTVDQNNPHRLIRAIERAQSGLRPVKNKPDFEVLEIGVTWPREVLHSRIDHRVEERFKEGMLDEVGGLIQAGVDVNWLLKLGLEYRVITSFLLTNNEKIKNKNSNIVHPSRSVIARSGVCDAAISHDRLLLPPFAAKSWIAMTKGGTLLRDDKNIEAMLEEDCETLPKMKQKLKYRIHQFARRQETWFRRFPEIFWENEYTKIKNIIDKFLT